MSAIPIVAPLPPSQPGRSFSVATFNVLLPNGVDGWWIPKMYPPEVPDEARRWPHRQRRLAAILLGIHGDHGPDLICLQETSPESFAADFRFLTEAGYDALIHRKGRLRPATLWRTDRLTLIGAQHRDRVLVTTLAPTDGPAAVHLVNLHLTAGAHPDRRLRQVHEGLQRVWRTDPDPGARLVVCGDFNGYGPTAVRRLLTHGQVAAGVCEPRWPGRPLTSRDRCVPFGPLIDAYAAAYHPRPAPPTLIVPKVRPWMAAADGSMSAVLSDCLGQLFDRFGTIRGIARRWIGG